MVKYIVETPDGDLPVSDLTEAKRIKAIYDGYEIEVRIVKNQDLQKELMRKIFGE